VRTRGTLRGQEQVREWVKQLATRGQIRPFALIEAGVPLTPPKLITSGRPRLPAFRLKY
jgi:hypothetical protein